MDPRVALPRYPLCTQPQTIHTTRTPLTMEEDPFWLVQLTDNAENNMLAGEAPPVEYEVCYDMLHLSLDLHDHIQRLP